MKTGELHLVALDKDEVLENSIRNFAESRDSYRFGLSLFLGLWVDDNPTEPQPVFSGREVGRILAYPAVKYELVLHDLHFCGLVDSGVEERASASEVSLTPSCAIGSSGL